ncbi:glycosyltransferase family 2 protein [Tritonibacter aquimaris]|uniref:glycosyltransferase family 2 protein n=1 Tax=Tritonibacter aquimaris TaxID=2663379 RepID=UPI001295EE3E|nr:glycosyltransferase family 2 protein [Tritonibacter aquimaris]
MSGSITKTRHFTFEEFINQAADLGKGPAALIFVEDEVEIASTLRHHLNCGFKSVTVFMPDAFDLPHELSEKVRRVTFDCLKKDAVTSAVTHISTKAPAGCWLYYCYNAEYLFYPFCESRSIGEMLAFHSEERRDAMLCYVVDLYANNLSQAPDAVSVEQAHLDKSGYYAQARSHPQTGHPKERQLDFFGGLRWRYEEHIPADKRKIDRIALFKARPDLTLNSDHTFNDEEYNTYACPWHHNLTASICSFRTAKALRRNPGSRFEINSFHWHNSVPFDWNSQQLLDLGLIEPGQWF